MLQAQPAGATQLPSWGEMPPRLQAALGQTGDEQGRKASSSSGCSRERQAGKQG